MMGTYRDALKLIEMGFHVFPIAANTKVPLENSRGHKDATTSPEAVRNWWIDPDLEVEYKFNVGIATEKFKDNLALIVVDIDCKEKDGFASVEKLKSEGKTFPPTLTQRTTSGGEHFIYWAEKAVKQGTSVLGEGIDIRSRGGYIVGPGSSINGKSYEWIRDNLGDAQRAPQWLIDFLTEREMAPKVSKAKLSLVKDVDQETAEVRGLEFLQSIPAVSSGSRNDEGYKAVCVLKDLGCTQEIATHLMTNAWKCEPMLDHSEIEHLVNSAYSYGKNSPGALAPEAMFEPSLIQPPNTEPDRIHPFLELNKTYFYTRVGGKSRVCEECVDEDGRFKLDRMLTETFFDTLAGQSIEIGGRIQPLAKSWFESRSRRSYKGIVFRPTADPTPGYYNLWRGFTVEPKPREGVSPAGAKAFELFQLHTLNNICQGDVELHHWLMGYFAHLFQKPAEKPGVAIVLKGKKGTGKNVFIETIGALLGQHAIVVSDRRYLVGNFNSITENKLLFTLNEAFWSGDKAAEGILKSLVTEDRKMIEHKGVDPSEVKSLERVVILGNEDWLVPASADERRYAVFNVGDHHRNDRPFFKTIKEGMNDICGGLNLLLSYFLSFDLSDVEVRKAPNTEGLAEQKENSLGSVESWWLQCLQEERIVGNPADSHEWPDYISCSMIQDCFRAAKRNEGNRDRMPRGTHFGRYLVKVAPSLFPSVPRKMGGQVGRFYALPPIDLARREWDKYLGVKTSWE